MDKKKKVTIEDLGLKFDGMPEAQSVFLRKCAEMVVSVVNKSNEGLISDAEFIEKMNEAIKPFKDVDNESFKSLVKENEDLQKLIKNLGEELEKLKKDGRIGPDFVSKFDDSFNEMYDSEKFQHFINDHGPAAKGFVMKDVSLTGNYTGTSRAMLTQQSGIIVTQATDKKDHIRNHIAMLESDEEKTSITYQEIYDVDRNARYVAENGMLPESSFKVREKSAEVKRCGTYFKISKRMLKNRKFVRAFVLLKIVQAVRNAEDFGLIYGDGNGDNLKGIANYEGVLNVADVLTSAIVTVPAGSVTKIEEVVNGVRLTIDKPYDLLMEGLKLTVSGATKNTGLNATWDVIKINDTQLLLEGATLTDKADASIATDTEALKLVAKNGLYQSIETPNSTDALKGAIAVMSYAEFDPTILCLNPLTITAIACEKATDGNALNNANEISSGKIGSVTVLPCKDIPVGEYFLGDFESGCALIEYTPLMLEWCDDVETKLKNQVVLYAQEELIFPVMKPHAFAKGKISALKTALKKTV